jgi:hypothetical protein
VLAVERSNLDQLLCVDRAAPANHADGADPSRAEAVDLPRSAASPFRAVSKTLPVFADRSAGKMGLSKRSWERLKRTCF